MSYNTSYIKKLILKGKTEKAIKYCCLNSNDMESHVIDQIILISGEFNKLEQDFISGIITEQERSVQYNKINVKILKLISKDNITKEQINTSKDLSYIPYQKEEEIIGRKEELIKIKSLVDKNHCLLIHGIRGIGKSSLLRLFINENRKFYNYAIWINVLNDIKESILNDKNLLNSIQLEPTNIPELNENKNENNKDSKFNYIISKLKKFKADKQKSTSNILILDNVKDLNEAKKIFQKFPKSHWRIIVSSTSYSDFFQNNNVLVRPLKEKKVIELFNKNANINLDEKELFYLKLILNEVGNHTLTIELLSKVYSYGLDFNLEHLFNLLKTNNLSNSVFDLEVETMHNNYEAPIKAFSYIKNIFDITKITNTEEIILDIFSILPPIEIKGSILVKSFNHISNKMLYSINNAIIINNFFRRKKTNTISRFNLINAMNSLVNKGWIIRENKEYKCHEIIREIIFQELKRKKIYLNFLFHYIYEPALESISMSYHFKGDYIKAFLIHNNIINLYLAHSYERNIKKVCDHYIGAIANLGNIGLSPIAINFIEEGNRFFSNKEAKLRTYWLIECMRIFIMEKDDKTYLQYKKEVETNLEMISLNKKNATVHLRFYNIEGTYAYTIKKNFKQAKLNYQKSLSVYDDFNLTHDIGYARLLSNISLIYIKIRKYEKARECLEESLTFTKKMYGHNDHPLDKSNLQQLKTVNLKIKKSKRKR